MALGTLRRPGTHLVSGDNKGGALTISSSCGVGWDSVNSFLKREFE
jgi:hypothetical protein